MQFTTIFTKEQDWWYTVQVLELPWCTSYGSTLEESQEMIKEAIQGYIESMKKHWESLSNLIKPTFISSYNFYETIQTWTDNKVLA